MPTRDERLSPSQRIASDFLNNLWERAGKIEDKEAREMVLAFLHDALRAKMERVLKHGDLGQIAELLEVMSEAMRASQKRKGAP